jgi:phosphoglycolate phosphatase
MTAIIFDLDGTLVQSAEAIRQIASNFMAERGLPLLTLEEAHAYIGHGSPHFLTEALKARDAFNPATFDQDYARLQHYYATAPGSANVPFPGVTDTLQALHARGLRLGVCTNKPGVPTQMVLDAHGWAAIFSAVIAGDTLEKKKPDPAPLHEAARQLEAERVIYVGDSDVDAEAAHAAGFPFFLFTEGYRKAAVADLPHAVAFSDFHELAGLIEEFWART